MTSTKRMIYQSVKYKNTKKMRKNSMAKQKVRVKGKRVKRQAKGN